MTEKSAKASPGEIHKNGIFLPQEKPLTEKSAKGVNSIHSTSTNLSKSKTSKTEVPKGVFLKPFQIRSQVGRLSGLALDCIDPGQVKKALMITSF